MRNKQSIVVKGQSQHRQLCNEIVKVLQESLDKPGWEQKLGRFAGESMQSFQLVQEHPNKLSFVLTKVSVSKYFWTDQEHLAFLRLYNTHGKDWKYISDQIQGRSPLQVRTHAQKYHTAIKQLAQEVEDALVSHANVHTDFYVRLNKYLADKKQLKSDLKPGMCPQYILQGQDVGFEDQLRQVAATIYFEINY